MISAEVSKHIADTIRHILSNGFHMEPDVVSFIESTWGYSMDQICRDFPDILHHVDDPDLLIERIVYPDERMQIDVEEVFQAMENHMPEENAIIEQLQATPVLANIFLPDRTDAIKVELNQSVLERFVKRLHINRLIPSSLRDTVRLLTIPEKRTAVSVKLRNSRFPFTKNRTEMLSTYLRCYPEDDSLFSDAFDFILEFLMEIKDDTHIRDDLVAKRKLLNHHIQKAEDLEKYLTKTNMETFLLSGNRVFGVHVPSVRKQILLIRSILYHVYNECDTLLEDKADMQFQTYTQTLTLDKTDAKTE